MKNTPYTKVIDPILGLLNPITGTYINPFPNRKARRVFKNRERFVGNGKTANLNEDWKVQARIAVCPCPRQGRATHWEV